MAMTHDEYKRGWRGGLPETKCGSGSRLRDTRFQREWIPAMVAKHGITSIADIGAGDLNWIQHTELGCDYAAYDLVPRHPFVQQFDLLSDPLPAADCYMVLWVLNHLHPDDQAAAMDKLLNSQARFLMLTYSDKQEPCTDIPYIEKALLKRRKGTDFEIRLCTLQ